MAFAQQVSAQTPRAVDELLVQDARLAEVAENLLGANARLCRALMPLTGMVIHSRDQYGPTAAGDMFANGPVAVALVLPNSPAAQAGIRAGDALTAIGPRAVAALTAQGEAPLRDTVIDTLADTWPGVGPLALTLRRAGETLPVTLAPRPGCRALVEVRTGNGLGARSDGRVIQVDQRLAQAASDGDLAVLFAHELAHLVLEHRRRLGAAGVEKGFFGQFGRNQQLNRQVEVEADRLSVHLLANAGLDPAIAPAFWRSALAGRAAGGLRLSATYPTPEARAALIEREIADYLGGRGGASSPFHLLDRRDESLVAQP